MTYEFSTDFNNALPQNDLVLIPAGTLAKVTMTLRPGGFGPGQWLTKSDRTGSVYLNTELTILEGPYARRKVYHLIGIEGSKRNAKGEDTWGMNGRTMIRSILESARNIHPNDRSQNAIEGRTINDLLELMGIEFGIKIGVEEDKSGNYQPKNTVLSIITPNYSSYASVMGVSSSKPKALDVAETEAPATSVQPSWLNR